MATKRKRGDSWTYTVRRADLLRKPLYLTFEDEREGDEYVKRLEAQLDRGHVPIEFTEKREVQKGLRDGIRRYRAAQHISDDDAKLLVVITDRLPVDFALGKISFTWATDWVSKMKREENLAPSTIRHHVGALSRALDWLASQGDVVFNPLRSLRKGYATYTPQDIQEVKKADGVEKEDLERDRRLEHGEEDGIRAILAGAKPEGKQRALVLAHGAALNLLFDMALESAMRMREMYTLDIGQVDLDQNTIFLDRTKNGDKRQVPITSVLHKMLVPLVKGRRKSDRLFPWWNGDLDKKELARTTSLLSRQYGRIFEAAKCDGLHFHDLRHEATSRFFERTQLSDLEISNITGHKDPRMLKRYANLRGSKLAARLW